MALDFLKPVSQGLVSQLEDLHPSCIGNTIAIHSEQNGLPELEEAQIAILGVRENRRETGRLFEQFDFDALRSGLYSLFPGYWHTNIVDLGDIPRGERVEDTEYAFYEILDFLLNHDIIPLILGGSQDLTYANYRVYDQFEKMVNLVNVDARFDLGNTDAEITDASYVGKMIVEKPYNLFNYVNLGYQSYLNPPGEIDLIEKLYFEAYRLGELTKDFKRAEPIMRDTDILSIDINAVASVDSGSEKNQPNGLNGREICALARYGGISDKVSSFGLYNLQNLPIELGDISLPIEILWYFIEGVNFRKNEESISLGDNYLKYSVPIDQEMLTFYKSKRSGRWWIEIPAYGNNKLKEHTFLPCSYEDYLSACDQEIPNRWYKARRRNEL